MAAGRPGGVRAFRPRVRPTRCRNPACARLGVSPYWKTIGGVTQRVCRYCCTAVYPDGTMHIPAQADKSNHSV